MQALAERGERRSGARIEVEELRSAAAMEAIEEPWRALWRSVAAPPFLSPDWLLPWWRHLGGGALAVFVARRGGALAGVLPMFVYEDDGRRRLMPLGIGISDYFDLLAAPALADEVAPALLRRLAAEAARWDTVEFHELAEGALLLDTALPAAIAAERRPLSVCPVLALPAEGGRLAETVPRITLRNQRLAARRAAALGSVRLDQARDEAAVDRLLEALFALHAGCWKERGEAGVLAEERLQRFHRETAIRFLREGALRLYGLRVGEALVAAWYGFRSGDRVYAYLSGFDPLPERQSFGTLLMGLAIEQAVAEGAAEFDFLRGEEGYKSLWGAAPRANVKRVLRAAR